MNPGLFSFHTLTLGPFGHSRMTVRARRLIGSRLFVAMLVVLPCMNLAWCAEPLFSGLHSVCVHYICVWLTAGSFQLLNHQQSKRMDRLTNRSSVRQSLGEVTEEVENSWWNFRILLSWHGENEWPYICYRKRKTSPSSQSVSGLTEVLYSMCSIEMCSLYFSFFIFRF